MESEKDNSSTESFDRNIRRLLKSAFRPAPAATFFKMGLLKHLKDEMLRSSKGEARQQESSDAFEENLSKLLAAAGAQDIETEAKPGFRERLRDEVVTAGGEAYLYRHRRRRLNVITPALATAVVGVILFMVLLVGIEIYPTYWADEGTEVAVTMNEGSGTATETRPLFFIWGTRTTKSNLDSGEDVSLSAGDKITVDSGSTAVIDFFNGSSVKLYPGSELEINELESMNDQGSPYARVTLNEGRATSQINSFSYELATPSTVAAVLGTAFRTEVISDDHTYLATSEGAVELTMNGDTVEVKAGEEVDAVKGAELAVKEASGPILAITGPDNPAVSSPDIVLTGVTDIEAEVTVNGEPVPVNLDSTFSVELHLNTGSNPVVVTATSPAGKTITVYITLELI